MRKLFIDTVTKLVDWLIRRREPGLALVRGGLAVLIALAVSWGFAISVPTPWGTFQFSFKTGDDVLTTINGGIFVAVVIVIGIGLLMTWRAFERKRAIAVELRGLRDTSGDPLKDNIPASIPGRREQILVDLRQGADGRLLDPGAALEKLRGLPATIHQMSQGLDRSDIRYIAGGVAPVPYSFLAGILLDDEGHIELMDWDRHAQGWRALADVDDGRRFIVEGLDRIGTAREIVLAISVSYATDADAIAETFQNMPVVRMILPEGSVHAHWSAQKQAALTKQFLDLAVSLRATKVWRIHLVLAAPSSVVINFGRRYDKRNLPEIVVYQYEQGNTPRFPWGVLMPVAGNASPSIIDRTAGAG